MLWANLVLKRHDAVLVKVKDSISFKSFMDLHGAGLSGSNKLFPFRGFGENGGEVFMGLA